MKVRLVRALSVLAIGGAIFSSATSAQAVTVQFNSTVAFTESPDINKLTFSSSGLNANLTVGVADVISNFIHVTVDNGAWNTSPTSSLTAAFTFTVPSPSGATTDVGTITGAQVNGNNGGTLSVVWPGQPVLFSFADGTKLQVTLGDFNTTCAGNNCFAGNDNIFMSGTFLVLNGPTAGSGPEVAATPIPGALPLFASGMGVFGYFGWRRKRKLAA